MIFHIPHSSMYVPSECRDSIVLTDADLQKELLAMTDHYTNDIFGSHANSDDTVVMAQVSRLVVDVERFEDDSQEEMAGKGMGVIYTRTSGLTELRLAPNVDEREHLLNTYYRPHHDTLAQSVQAELDEKPVAFVLDCHSFPSAALPYESDQNSIRPDFCLGTDIFHTPAGFEDLVSDFLNARGYSVAINSPFSGALVPAKYYKENKNVASLMIEINRKLYMNENSGAENAGYMKISSTIGELIEYIRLFIENEDNLSALHKQHRSCLAYQDWVTKGRGAGSGRVELYELNGRYFCFSGGEWSEYDSLPEAFSESDVLAQTAATKTIVLNEDLIEQILTDADIDWYRSALEARLEEWLGFDIPEEGTEDYESWMMRVLDLKDVKKLSDIRNWVECYSSDDFVEFLAFG